MINGYKNWLQNALGKDYLIVEEEKTDFVEDKNLAILKEFSGINYRSCIMFTYQLVILTNDVEKTMSELQEKTWMLNDIKLATDEFPFIKHLMSQPVNNSNYLQMSTDYVGTITITITLMASVNLTDIKHLQIDDEIIDPTLVTVTYQSQGSTNRTNDEELSTTNINNSTLNFQVTFPIDNSNVYKKSRDVMFGKLPKNTKFNFNIEFMDGEIYNYDFKMNSKAIQYDRSALTTATITFIK